MKCFVRGYYGEGFGAKLIDKFTFGNGISHVSLVFDMGHKREEIESIQFKGVIAHEPHSSYTHKFVEFAVPLTEIQILDAHIKASGYLGAKYDWQGIFGFVRRRAIHSEEKWFCSEFVAYILYKVGYALSRRCAYRETPTSVCESLRLIAPIREVGSA